MRHRTDIWVKLAARGRFRMEAKARINEKDYLKISAPKIERNLASTPLTVGGCSSATLSLSILTDDEIKSTSPVVIMGRLTDGNNYSEWLEFGTFFIDQRDTSFEGLITIDCFDAMLRANQPYLDDSDSSSSWPKTMKEVVEEIAYRIGVGIDPRTKINTDADYIVPYPLEMSMMQVLSDIGACHGGNWIITEENLLRLVPLVTAPDETFHIISHDYEKIKTSDGHLLIYDDQEVANAVLPDASGTTPESMIPITHYITDEYGNIIVTPEGHYLIWATDGSTNAVDGIINVPVVCGQITTGTRVTVTGIKLSNSNGDCYTAGDDTGIVLTIEGNPYATQGICDNLYNAFNGLVYLPYTATKAVYDPATELGDQVKIGDMVHSVLFTSRLDFNLNFRADIGAPNSEAFSSEYPYLSEVGRLKHLTTQLGSDKADSIALLSEIERATGAEAQLSGGISAEVERAMSVEISLDQRIRSIEDLPIGALNERVTALESTVNEHDAHINSLSTSVGEHTEAIGVNAANISALQTTVEEHATDITRLETAVTKIDTLETTVAEHTSLISDLSGKVSNLEVSIADIYQRLEALEGTDTGI